MFYPSGRNPWGTQLITWKSAIQTSGGFLPSLEFHTRLSDELELDCLARKHRGIFTLWRSARFYFRRFLIFLGKIDNIFNIDGSSIECWKILKAQPGAKSMKTIFLFPHLSSINTFTVCDFSEDFYWRPRKTRDFCLHHQFPPSWKLKTPSISSFKRLFLLWPWWNMQLMSQNLVKTL